MRKEKSYRKILGIIWLCTLVGVLASCSCKHEFGEWATAQEATCDSEGMLSRTCTKCGEVEQCPIPSVSHTFSSWETSVESTCIKEGSQVRTCTICGFEEECQLALAAHVFGEWEVTKAATCTTAGVECSICSVCGTIEERDTELEEHSFKWSTTQSATCTSSGSRNGVCSVCGASQTETLPATGHNWTPVTCKSPKTCKSCGISEGGTSGHTWNAATCMKAKTCSVCGVTEGSALGHHYNSSGVCGNCGSKMVSITLKIPTNGGYNAYACLNVTNYTDSTITFPKILSINGKTCNSDGGYQLAPGCSAKLNYYRAIVTSQRYDNKSYDMYLDNNSIGYCVITWNGTQYYAEYGVNGITKFYRGNVNGPA